LAEIAMASHREFIGSTNGASRDVMRAARIVAPRCIEVVDAPLPQPGHGQVRLRLEGCGVCGSNLAVWQGRPWTEYPLPPGSPGHEGWGIIDAIGPGVTLARPGDRVAFLSANAYAEYDVAGENDIVAAPPDASVFPGEALGCAVNAFRRSAIEAGGTVAVVGVGFIGALIVELAARAGARVIALSRRPFALAIARRAGAAETLALGDAEAAVARVMEITGGCGADCVVEAAGEQTALDVAARLTRVRGRLVIAGYHQGERRVDMQLWNWRGLDVVNAHERDPHVYVDGMREAATAVAERRLDPSFLYTHGFALDDFAAAFAALEARPDGFLKSWIQPKKG
jgi:threonine dehydrogenase-like Zn-dependent dehydrogenase